MVAFGITMRNAGTLSTQNSERNSGVKKLTELFLEITRLPDYSGDLGGRL